MQVDFLMVVDAGVKELFPPHMLQNVPQLVFEQQVLSAHDRAFEEQRFAPMLWDTLFERFEDKMVKTRIYNALEAGAEPLQSFFARLAGRRVERKLSA